MEVVEVPAHALVFDLAFHAVPEPYEDRRRQLESITNKKGEEMTMSVKLSKRVGRGLSLIALILFLSGGWSGKDARAAFAPRVEFDCCLVDDSSGLTLQFSSFTGFYQVFDGSGNIILTGTGTVKKKGCTKTLAHLTADRRVRATLDTCAERGSAAITILAPAPCTMTITDRDTDDNECFIK